MAGTDGVAPPVVKGPSFLGLPLRGPSVVYLLDRGDATRSVFDLTIMACQKSLETLSPNMKYQVVFWEVNGKVEKYPAGGMEQATAENTAKCRAAIEDIIAGGRGEPIPALEQAMKQKPEQIILATGKSLEPEDAQAIVTAARAKKARVDTLALGRASSADMMKTIADKTGGTFRAVSDGELNAMKH